MKNIKVMDCEEDWIKYSKQEFEVKLELTDMIFDYLILDTVGIFLHIGDKR